MPGDDQVFFAFEVSPGDIIIFPILFRAAAVGGIREPDILKIRRQVDDKQRFFDRFVPLLEGRQDVARPVAVNALAVADFKHPLTARFDRQGEGDTRVFFRKREVVDLDEGRIGMDAVQRERVKDKGDFLFRRDIFEIIVSFDEDRARIDGHHDFFLEEFDRIQGGFLSGNAEKKNQHGQGEKSNKTFKPQRYQRNQSLINPECFIYRTTTNFFVTIDFPASRVMK